MTPFVEGVFRKVGPPIAVITCATMSAWLFLRYYYADKFANDFGVYWRVVRQPLEHIYSWAGNYPFPYAPTMLLWIQPLALIPKWPAYFLFIIVSVAAFVLACRPYLSKGAIALILVTRPFLRGIFTGQVCAILAAGTLWACGTKNRIAAGVAFAVMGSIKPQLIWMAPLMLLLNKDWRALGSGAAASFLILVSTVTFFGPDRWAEWLASMDHFKQALVNINAFHIGVTPAMWAEWWGLPPLPFMVAGGFAGAALVYACRDMEPLEKCTAIVAGSLLGAPYALDYDLVALFPFLAMIVMKGRMFAVIGLTGTLNPLPLLVVAYELCSPRGILGRNKRNRDNLPATANA